MANNTLPIDSATESDIADASEEDLLENDQFDDLFPGEGTERGRFSRFLCTQRVRVLVCAFAAICLIFISIVSLATLFAFTLSDTQQDSQNSSSSAYLSSTRGSATSDYYETQSLDSYSNEKSSEVATESPQSETSDFSSEDDEYPLDTVIQESQLIYFTMDTILFTQRERMISEMLQSLTSFIHCPDNCTTDTNVSVESRYTIESIMCDINFDFTAFVEINEILSGMFKTDLSVVSRTTDYENGVNLPMYVNTQYQGTEEQNIRQEHDNCDGIDFIRDAKISGLDYITLVKCKDWNNYFPELLGEDSTTRNEKLRISDLTAVWKSSNDFTLEWAGKEYSARSLFQLTYDDYESAASGILEEPLSASWAFSVFNLNDSENFLEVTQPLAAAKYQTMQQYSGECGE